MAMQTDWCTWRDCESSDILSSENRAIFRILKEWQQLAGLFGGALRVDGSMVAYTGLTDQWWPIPLRKH
jgi:hypothetical protein